MITVSNVSLRFGDKKLFEDVNLKFTPGHCYGVIGANGAGKSTFLKILSGEIEPQTGDVSMAPDSRLTVLKQDHFAYEDHQVLDTVLMGHEKLYQVKEEKDAIYMKADFSEEDGMRAAELEGEFAEMNGREAESDAAVLIQGLDTVLMGNEKLYQVKEEKDAIYMKADFSEEYGMRAAELEGEFAEMNGWEAESDAAVLLKGLGIDESLHMKKMADLSGDEKV